MKRNFRIILFIIVGFWTGSHVKAQGSEFRYGTIKKGIYTNLFFEMSISVPAEWRVKNKKDIEQMADELKNRAMGVPDIKSSAVSSATLLSLVKGNDSATLPAFSIMTENVSLYPDLKTSKAYLLQVKQLLSKTSMAYEFDDSIAEVMIGGRSFYALYCRIGYDSLAIYQNYYCSLVSDYALSIIQTYRDEDEHKAIETLAETMHFRRDQ